ncbi:MAG: alpha/beta hydrolase [Acidimicrobiia bacterium]|nr:alpha/beta hydrolase [bacterium]MXW59720.1 alpha/beta hydrolase [Acidimicrobiia bacterium]MDE0614457.1 alpha/beta hydrolase [bacterium]MXZ86646.1 alpha/beta hydrolase [Acidimicrobiia bacterium]MYB74078.1 alpha/beta hydrolase [Acidimicrobiia bacterium]
MSSSGAPIGPSLPPGESIDLPGRGQVFVRRAEGPPGSPTVMLLHGWTVTADLNWYPAFQPISQRASVVAFDHRGHGDGLPTRRFRFADCASDVLAVADALGIDRFVCVGYSMGGAIAQLAARSAPDRVTGLVLGATSTSFRGRGLRAIRFSLLPVVAAASRLAPLKLRYWGWEQTVFNVIGTNIGRWAQTEVLKGDPQAMLDAGTELFNFDSSDWIAELPMPIAQIRTLGDNVVPDYLQQELGDAVSDLSVFSYRGGHASVVTDFDSFWDCLSKALDSVGVPAGSEIGSSVAPDPSSSETSR